VEVPVAGGRRALVLARRLVLTAGHGLLAGATGVHRTMDVEAVERHPEVRRDSAGWQLGPSDEDPVGLANALELPGDVWSRRIEMERDAHGVALGREGRRRCVYRALVDGPEGELSVGA